jgi:hypothetical protein
MNKQLQRANWLKRAFHLAVSKAIIVIISVITFFPSCEKAETAGSAEEVLIQEVAADNPNCICDPYINQYKWNNKIVYVLASKGPACNSIPTYYDANGKRFEMTQEITFDLFLQQSTLIKNVWSCN